MQIIRRGEVMPEQGARLDLICKRFMIQISAKKDGN